MDAMDRRVSALVGVIAFVVLLTFATGAWSKPVLRLSGTDVVITLYDDKKSCPAAANLLRKAVWLEKGKSVEGCWGFNPIGVVMFWFEDKTVAAAPAQAFVEINEI
jgi:hypothetical protein